MSQKTISSFFKTSTSESTKRSKDSENIDDSNIQPDKKAKIVPDLISCHNFDTNSDLMQDKKEEQKVESIKDVNNPKSETVDESKSVENTNKLKAQLKLLSKSLPALHTNIGLSWFEALRPEFEKPYFKKLSNFLSEERSNTVPVFPIPENVWTWTRECKVDDVKVVIIGQDPYHNPGQAHGLSFSVPIGVPPPPSLLNMYKELEQDDEIEGFKRPGHGYLVGWARQGVLLLNAVLTVKCRTPNSHKDQGWEKLTDAVIKHLNSQCSGIVFLLWGAYAQKKADFLDKKKHHLLKTVHPSPLSASRGFFGCKHFSKCNQLLREQGKTPIDWSLLPTN